MIVDVPAFARLDDYCGLWSVEPGRFAAMRDMVRWMDLAAHMQGFVGPPLTPSPQRGEGGARAAIEKVQAPSGRTVAVIRLTGMLMKAQSSFGGTSTIQARRDVRQAVADPDVGAILLAIDSPGGTVAGIDDLAADIRAAGKQKPVWAHIEDLGASAAYWAASQASRVTANSATALVGSIGTFQVVQDLSGAAEKEGVRVLLFSTGPLKGLGVPGTKVTEEQAAHVQRLVNAVQEQFDAAVQKGRKLSAKELAAVRHGGTMPATEAMERKLVDAIQPLGKTITELGRSMQAVGSGVFPTLRASA